VMAMSALQFSYAFAKTLVPDNGMVTTALIEVPIREGAATSCPNLVSESSPKFCISKLRQ
jgi:hypothetical protein